MGDHPVHVGAIGSGTRDQAGPQLHEPGHAGRHRRSVHARCQGWSRTAGTLAGDPTGSIGRRRTFDGLIDQFLPGEFDTPQAALRIIQKDMMLATGLGRELGVPMRFANLALADIQEAVNRGWSERDCRAVMLLPQERSGVAIKVPSAAIQAVLREDPPALRTASTARPEPPSTNPSPRDIAMRHPAHIRPVVDSSTLDGLHAAGLRRRTVLASLAAFGTLAGSRAYAQQEYPVRPVRLVTPYEAGTITDLVARSVGQALAQRWKQPVVIDNKVGAGGLIGSAAAATAPPDGYTLLMGTNGTHAINPALHAKLPYDAVKGFIPVSQVGSGYSLLVVHPSVEAKSVAELIALAKAKPNQIRFGSGGIGTTPHLAGELFKMMAGVQIEHVAYKSSTHSTLDLLEGHIQMIFANVAAVGAHVKAGKLRVLGITTPQRIMSSGDVPTVSESGLPGFAAGILARHLRAGRRVPADRRPDQPEPAPGAYENEEIIRHFARQGFVVKTSTPPVFAGYVRDEMAKWGAVVKASGAKPE